MPRAAVCATHTPSHLCLSYNVTNITFQSFYLGLRQGLTHYRLANFGEYKFPADHTQVVYQQDPSTKIDKMLEIVHHHKDKICGKPLEPAEGEGEIIVRGPAQQAWRVVPGAGPDKIIVYCAFPKNNWIVRKVN